MRHHDDTRRCEVGSSTTVNIHAQLLVSILLDIRYIAMMEPKNGHRKRPLHQIVSFIPLLLVLAARLCGTQAFVSPLQTNSNQQRTFHSDSTIRCNLFFRSKRPRTQSSWRIPDAALEELSEASVSFPHSVWLESRNEEQKPREIIIRTLEKTDLDDIVPICVKEFGPSDPPITKIDQIPWNEIMKDSSILNDVTERIIFGPMVRMSLEMKINRQQVGEDPGRPYVQPDDTVLCVESDGNVVAIVDLSRQPPDPERIPPPVPLPISIKKLLSTARGLPPPDAWVTNLLVDDSCRGQGYGKLLMKAAEGLARSWQCKSIYLHVDADSLTGKVPQELYRGLGYEPVVDEQSQRKYEWMGPELVNRGLYVIDNVPLLFLRKDLTEE